MRSRSSRTLVLFSILMTTPTSAAGAAGAAGKECSVSAAELEAYLKQDWNTFDQSSQGWRKLSSEPPRCFVEVSQLIDSYHFHHLSDLKPFDRLMLHWHAGQNYAFAGLYGIAVARFEQCKNKDEPARAGFRWNAYVDATLAFLKRDLAKLRSSREQLAVGKDPVNVMNLHKIDGLIQCFNQSYREAFLGCSKPDKAKSPH